MENGSAALTRAELKIELEATKAELSSTIKDAINLPDDELQESNRDSETEISRAIHAYVEASEARLVRLERNDRLSEIERRLIMGGKGAA